MMHVADSILRKGRSKTVIVWATHHPLWCWERRGLFSFIRSHYHVSTSSRNPKSQGVIRGNDAVPQITRIFSYHTTPMHQMRPLWRMMAHRSQILSLGAVITGSVVVYGIATYNTTCVSVDKTRHQNNNVHIQNYGKTPGQTSIDPNYSNNRDSIPTILATSSLPLINNNDKNPFTNIDKQLAKKRWSWWKLRWWNSPTKSRPLVKSTWLQKIKQTFFVITRGIEIVVRLSPLLVLTPTAVVVSYVEPLWKHYATFLFENRNLAFIPLRGGVASACDEDEHYVFVHQLQDSLRNNQQQSDHHMPDHGHTWASNLAWRYTLHTLQSLGPAFVKLGQWAATRRDLFPIHTCNRLSDLHDMARTHEWKYTHAALVEAFGSDYESRGLVIMEGNGMNHNKNASIIGSGSAAQVHKGMLTITDDDNASNKRTKMVAIKVLHPNTSNLVERDLALMRLTADFIDRCIPLEMIKMLSLPRAVANFSDVMTRQVDLRIESSNLQVFRENFGCSEGNKFVKETDGGSIGSYFSAKTSRAKNPPTIEFPKPEEGWISEKVLVEDHAGDDAVPISRYLADDSPARLEARRKLAKPLLRAFLKMVFVDNFVHADLHPGSVTFSELCHPLLFRISFLTSIYSCGMLLCGNVFA